MSSHKQVSRFIKIASIGLLLSLAAHAQQDNQSFIGRWDITIDSLGRPIPSWLEIVKSGEWALVGRMVTFTGSVRPISEIKVDNGKFSFTIPSQWSPGEPKLSYIEVNGALSGDGIKGTIQFAQRPLLLWVGVRAPSLVRDMKPAWGTPIKLFNGKDLQGWKKREGSKASQWTVEGGVLKSPKSGADLISEQKFMDFKIHVEFRYQKNGNSGIYLRGRYETQVADDKGKETSPIYFGAIYGFIEPSEIAAKEGGAWQTMDITLIGRRVTIVANGITVVSDRIIPGITGGALDSNEGEPGPIMIQGDHEPIEFRSIVITPGR